MGDRERIFGTVLLTIAVLILIVMSVEYTELPGCYIWRQTLIINKSAFATADVSEVNISKLMMRDHLYSQW